jgi:predicted dehydrogenase
MDLVLRAAANGKHIFCEKPLATNLADVQEMVAATERRREDGRRLDPAPLTDPHGPESLMTDSTLGRLMAIVFRDDQFFPVQGHYGSEWRKDRHIVGSGTLLEHSIHDADILLWLGGEVTGVRGSVGNFAGFEGVEDLATAHLEFASGAKGELISIWHSVLGRPSTRRIEVFMEKGVFFLDNDFLGPIQMQTHAKIAEVLPEEEVRRRYLSMLGLTDPVFMMLSTPSRLLLPQAVSQGRDAFRTFDGAGRARS